MSEASIAPTNAAPVDEDARFSKALRWSLIGHAALFLFALVGSFVLPSSPSHYAPVLRVDIVGLPDILKKDLKDLPPLPPAEADPSLAEALKQAERSAEKIKDAKPVELPKPDEVALNPKKVAPPKTDPKADKQARDRMKNALNRIKALEKITSDDTITHKSPVIKGNAVSRGTSLSGDAREAAEASYYDLLRDHLQRYWELPVWLARQNHAAQVRIQIDSSGRLRGLSFTKPSGNAQFDEAVRKTLQENQPFPRPPQGLASSVATDGVTIGFPL